MAILEVDNNVRVQTARLLLQVADNPDQVVMTHGPAGIVFLVPDEVAERFVLAVEADNRPTPKKKAK